MALVSSLFTAISGMRNHQTMLDVISNNIANVNTVGFKAGRVQFRDLLSQSISGAVGSDPLNNTGGINPMQQGTGVAVAAVDTRMSQGALQATGNATDMAINGDGFFLVKSGNDTLYTRAGSFRFDSTGHLVDPEGALVQGWTAQTPATDPLGRLVLDTSNPANIGSIQINAGQTMAAHETRNISLQGNLDAGATAANLVNSSGVQGTVDISVTDYSDTAAVPNTYNYTVGQQKINFTAYDSLGNAHNLIMTLTNLSGTQIPHALAVDPVTGQPNVYENNTWSWSVAVDPADTTVGLAPDNMTYNDPVDGSLIRTSHSGLVQFNTDGSLNYVTYMDANGDAATDLAVNPNASATYAGYGLSADLNRGTVIGFEGANITGADAAVDSTINVPVTDDPLANTTAGQATGLVDLTKLPIVLVYQSFTTPPASPTPPANNTAGAYIDATTNNLAYTDMTQTVGTTPQALYVQKFDINWGGVSTVTNADFDWMNQNNIDSAQNLALLAPTVGEAGGGRIGDGDRDWSTGMGGVQPRTLSLGNGDRTGLTQDATGSFQLVNGVNVYVPKFTAYLSSQDGFAEGILQSVNVDSNGRIVGSFSNGQTEGLAQVAVANFQNPAGLAMVGSTHFTTTANSGNPIVGTANTGGRGGVVGGVVEQSNVDLTEELTNMIVAQRGFEVNARLVSTSDTILNTLVNLGR